MSLRWVEGKTRGGPIANIQSLQISHSQGCAAVPRQYILFPCFALIRSLAVWLMPDLADSLAEAHTYIPIIRMRVDKVTFHRLPNIITSLPTVSNRLVPSKAH